MPAFKKNVGCLMPIFFYLGWHMPDLISAFIWQSISAVYCRTFISANLYVGLGLIHFFF
jgi:hypothetical protein